MRTSIIAAVGMLAAIALTGFVPGSKTAFVNASTEVARIRCQTTNRLYERPMGMWPSSRLGLSGDYGELKWLIVTFASGKSIRFSQRDIEHIKAAAKLRQGVWWITNSDVQYVSGREANIRQRQLTGGKL